MPMWSGAAWETPLRSPGVGSTPLIKSWVLAWWPFCPDCRGWVFLSDVALTHRPFLSVVCLPNGRGSVCV